VKNLSVFHLRALAAMAIVLMCPCLTMAQNVKHVTHNEAVEAATNKPTPEYSAIAKQLKLQGTVQLNVYVTEGGKVERIEGVAGNPLLIKCAEDTLRKWTFQPFAEEGKPVKAVAGLTFTFKL
jgi:protein TonB